MFTSRPKKCVKFEEQRNMNNDKAGATFIMLWLPVYYIF